MAEGYPSRFEGKVRRAAHYPDLGALVATLAGAEYGLVGFRFIIGVPRPAKVATRAPRSG